MTVTFQDGVEAWLRQIEIGYTYAGLIEGVICTRLNTWIVEEATQNADLVVAPIITPGPPIALSPEQGRMESLPAVTVRAHFRSLAAQAEECSGSALKLVWWQDEFPDHLSSSLQAVAGRVDWWSGAQDVDPALTPGW